MSKVSYIINMVNLEMEKQKAQMEENIKSLSRIKEGLQFMCPHDSIHYVPDPSGNNDSYWYCVNCGKEQRRF